MEQRALRMPSLLLRRESAVVGRGHGHAPERGDGGEGAVFSTGSNYSRLLYLVTLSCTSSSKKFKRSTMASEQVAL